MDRKNMVLSKSFFYLLIATFTTSGCGFSYSYSNVSDVKEYWGGYANGTTLTLSQDVFLIQLEGDRTWLAVTPEGRFEHKSRRYSAPVSIEAYSRMGGDVEKVSGVAYQIPVTVKGIIYKGASLKCCELWLQKDWSWWSGFGHRFYVFATIVDGEYQGKSVDILNLSLIYQLVNEEGLWVYEPEPQLIKVTK